MAVISLLNSHVFIFITVIILGTIIISIYMSVAPEKAVPYNFNPFPQEAPSALPDPTRQTDSCWNKLTPCDSIGQCSACSLGDYKCTQVTQDDFYHFNGINVPKGNWCLPNDGNPNPTCNTYTGRWLWTFDPEYCNSVSPGSTQCWKCECLYPSLFAGSEYGCTTQLACQNDSVRSQSVTQPNNQLVGSACSKPSVQGQTWNPVNGAVTDSDIYNFTPYDKDAKGDPWFTCDCPGAVDGQYFSRLPGDPHTCHLEPCYKYLQSEATGLVCSQQGCNLGGCSCNCDQTNFAVSPSGKYTNTCVLISDSCQNAGYDPASGQCDCGGGPSWAQQCRSDTTGVNADNTSLPECEQPQNALGSECINPCENASCHHGSPCISCGPDSYKEIPACAQSSEGTWLAGATAIHSACDCQAASSTPSPGFGGFFGPTCADECYGGGTAIHSSFFGQTCTSGGCNCCCALNSNTVYDAWYFDFKEVCNQGYPSLDNPPAQECLKPVGGQCPVPQC